MPVLPTGTVTFLFTDIEDSTRLWEEHSALMRVALARHDALLRAAIEANDGVVFKTVGDAFCAAFHIAPDALNAALAAQQALQAEVWPEPVQFRVRMALHTGSVESRDHDYFGPTLNRVARLLSAGHGGQVLLSDVASDLCRDALPPATALQEMGAHRLRDLNRPETVFQLLHPALPASFPPLKSLDHPGFPNNLPVQMTSFIGRETEIAEVKSLLAKTRLLTLTGIGGVGKTRLSLQVAAEALEEYPDGVWEVELAPLTDPALVPQAVAAIWGLKEQAGKPSLQTISESLKTKRTLLILDNCEHLLDACAQLSHTLLRTCPHVKILASSREGLGSAGELIYRVPSLSLPDLQRTATIESVTPYEAVRLFIERALFYQPTFEVTNQNAPALAQLCVHLDGIPLAIELAAARIRSLTVEEINDRIDNRFRLLTGGSRTALPRQQTLRALIDWSYDLLNVPEKTLLRRLSVFAGGWTLEAAQAVGVGEGSMDVGRDIEAWEVLDLLTSLSDKSLLMVGGSQGQSRYHFLETVRQYARERLEERTDDATVWERHQAFFVQFAEEAEPHLWHQEEAVWLDRLESEHDNLRAALEWDNPKAVLRLAVVLAQFWKVRGYYREGRERLAKILAGAGNPADASLRAKLLLRAGGVSHAQNDFVAAQTLYANALSLYQELADKMGIAGAINSLASIAHLQGDNTTARRTFEEALELHRELGNRRGIAYALSGLAAIAYHQGDYAAARLLYQEDLAIKREIGSPLLIARVLGNLGNIAAAQGDHAAAQTLLEETLEILKVSGDKSGVAYTHFSLGMVACSQGDVVTGRAQFEESLLLQQQLEDKRGIAYALFGLGDIAFGQGNHAEARTRFEESLALQHQSGDKQGSVNSLNGLGNIALAAGDHATGRRHFEEALILQQGLGDKRGIATSLEALAALASMQEPSGRAPCLWGVAEALREEIETPLVEAERINYDRYVAQARSVQNVDLFASAWAKGRAMTWEHGVVYALETGEAGAESPL